MHPDVEVIVFGQAEGANEVSTRLGLEYVPDIETNEFGTPLISAMFEVAQVRGKHHLFGYVNCDIILLDDFTAAINRVCLDRFLVVGQRWDLDLGEPVDFGANWVAYLRRLIKQKGVIHPPAGSDYFVFPRGLFRHIPPFAVGRVAWDNWMIQYCLSTKIPVVDATHAITVIHQNHEPYSHTHFVGGKVVGPESERNLTLAPSSRRITLVHANWLMLPAGLRPKKSLRYHLQTFIIMPVINPRFYGWLRPLAWILRKCLGQADRRLNGRQWMPDEWTDYQALVSAETDPGTTL